MHLLDVANYGTSLVEKTTKYLSTLPHPIECLEELISVVAVTSNLLTSLSSTLEKFAGTAHLASKSGPVAPESFLNPLCEDIQKGFKELEERIEEAKRLKVFEPNDVGLVRLPKNAWTLVLRGEARAAGLRSRLFVEKYRVRVLIEAVTWVGLNGESKLSESEVRQLRGLRNMLPLVAERLVGVQKDYVPRLKTLAAGEKEANSVQNPLVKPLASVEVKKEAARTSLPAPVVQEEKELVKAFKTSDPSLLKSAQLNIRSCGSTESLASTCSSSSSVTVIDDSIQEVWVLRCDEPRKKPRNSYSILGINCFTSYRIDAEIYFVKAIPSSPSEIKLLRVECCGSSTESEHQAQLRKKILKLPNDAQWEIQRLVESRDRASSNENVKREFQIVAFQERPRRKISPAKGKWLQGRKKGLVEWVIVLKGETVDHKTRVMPIKHDDPWNPRPKPQQVLAPPPPPRGINPPPVVQCPGAVACTGVVSPVQACTQARASVQAGTVLRHVENRRVMTVEEAEKKMEEIVKDLF